MDYPAHLADPDPVAELAAPERKDSKADLVTRGLLVGKDVQAELVLVGPVVSVDLPGRLVPLAALAQLASRDRQGEEVILVPWGHLDERVQVDPQDQAVPQEDLVCIQLQYINTWRYLKSILIML